MNSEELKYYEAAANFGLVPDEENPIFLFTQTHKDILLAIVNGKLDALKMAKRELRNRGLDLKTGKWIGWKNVAA